MRAHDAYDCEALLTEHEQAERALRDLCAALARPDVGRSRIICWLDTSNDTEAYAARFNRWYARAPRVRAAYHRRRQARRSGRR